MKSHPLLFRTAVSSLLTTALVLTLGGPASAQLADGPWSMYRHDVCHTGQSPNPGPLFTGTPPVTPGATDVQIWHGFDKLRTSPSLSADGATIYFGMGFDFCSVDAATMATNDCLLIPADVSDSSPAVGANGTIYMGDRDNSLNAYTSNPATKKLSLKWRYNHGHEGDIWQHPAIAPSSLPQAGTIYFSHDQSTDGAGIFTALLDQPDPATGQPFKVKWKFKIGNFVRQSSPAIDENGIIYFGDLNGFLYAFRDKGACPDNGTLRTQAALTSSCNNANLGPVLLWKKQVGSVPGLTASPVISADSNTLYIGTMSPVGTVNTPSYIPMGLTALDISTPCTAPCAAPAVKWTFKTTGKVDQTPALGRDGTLYVPAINGGEKRLYAVNPSNGSLKWTFGPFSTGSESSAQPIVGGDGTVYVGLGNNISALNPATGATLWTYATTNFIQSSPLIGPVTGGRAILYVPSRDHNLYAISSQQHSSTIVPTTCWTDGGGAPPGNQPPVAAAGPDQSGIVNQPVTFDGSGSFDPDGDPLTVTWTFGDGVGSHGPCLASAPGCLNPTYTYTTASAAGYNAILTVSDGQLSDNDTVKITVAPSGGGGGGSFQDTFTRADSDTLGGPSPSGPQWAEPVVTTQYTGNLAIAGNKLVNTARGDNIGYLPALTGANQSAAGDFTSGDNNASPRLGVLLRYQDARNHYRLYRISGGSSQLRISKIVNGTETILKSVQVPMAPLNTPFHLVGSASGTTLTLTLTGVPPISVVDSTYQTGSIGVLVNTGPTATHSADTFCAGIGTACP